MTTTEKVLEQVQRFEEVLPSLLEEHSGEWVVFCDGEVRSFHSDEQEAMAVAQDQCAVDSGYVVTCVAPRPTRPVTAAVLFG